jgi:uncharacterized phage infection (PIP) family protein YhgE
MAEDKNDILIKIKIEENRALRSLTKVKESVQKLDRRTREYKEAVAEQVRLETKLNSLRKRRVAINNKVETSVKRLTKSEKDLVKTQREGKTAVGASTSATLELGRVLSDMPYGIRGVANNLQQLASNLFFMSKAIDSTTGKTVGFGGAISSLLKGLIGPAGLLIAFQGVIALFDFFSNGQKKVEESTEDATNQITKQAKEIQRLQRITKTYYEFIGEALSSIKSDGTVFREELFSIQDVVKILSKDFSEFKDGIDSLSEQDKKDPKKLENLIKSFQSLLKYREDLDGLEERLDKFRELQKNNIKSFQEEEGGALIDVGKKVSSLTFEYVNLQRAILGLESLFEKSDSDSGDKSKKLSPFATPKELEIDIKSAENAIIQYKKKLEDARLKKELNDKLSEAKTEEEKAKIRRNYEKDRLINQINAERDSLKLKKSTEEEVVKTKVANHKAELERKHREFVYSVKLKEKLGEITSQQSSDLISESDELTNKAMSQADKEAEKSVEQIREKYKPLFALFESLAGSRLDALFSMPTKDGGKKDDKKFDFEDGLKKYMELQSSMTSFLSGEYDRQLTIEQNKTNALNNELNQRLLNENLSKDERERIQLQIGQNDEKLRKKQEAIEKKRFKLNKAANIANASINTYLAASQVLSSEVIPVPAKPFVMAATIASGLLQVAAIARQKFQSSAGSGGSIGPAAGSNGGGEGDREFNFNLAGSTQSNQLTQSIASQLSQPIQTYVVSSEITSQQQLDLNISNTATIG